MRVVNFSLLLKYLIPRVHARVGDFKHLFVDFYISKMVLFLKNFPPHKYCNEISSDIYVKKA